MLAMDYVISDITAISLAPFVYPELEHCRHELNIDSAVRGTIVFLSRYTGTPEK